MRIVYTHFSSIFYFVYLYFYDINKPSNASSL